MNPHTRLALPTLLLCAACTTSEPSNPTSNGQVVNDRALLYFKGIVNSDQGTFRIVPLAGSTSRGLMLLDIEQDGVPVSGTPENVELYTIPGTVGEACGINTFGGQVQLNSFYTVDLTNLVVQITNITPLTGFEPNNSDPPFMGLDNTYGIWTYPGSGSVRTWCFNANGSGNFVFTGVVWGDPLHRSCADIHLHYPTAPDGDYPIDPDGPGGNPSIVASCDMTTDGGGWTLVHNYVHQMNTNPATLPRPADLPLLNSTSALGDDESGTAYWGHAQPTYLATLPVEEFRFDCRTSNPAQAGRVMRFKTGSMACRSYFTTGTGGCGDLGSTSTTLPGHTANLPAAQDSQWTNQGDEALNEFPFYRGGTYHWGVSGSGSRWECDDYPNGFQYNTIHRVWVRHDPNPYPASCQEVLVQSPGSPDGDYMIDPDGGPALGFPPQLASCDMSTDGGGWTMILNYTHQGGTNPGVVPSTTLPRLNPGRVLGDDESGTDSFRHATPAFAATIPATELRFYCQTALHPRVMHFKTNGAACLSYVQSGTGSCNGIQGTFTPLAGHSANLPGAATSFWVNQGNLALTDFPFWVSGTWHWGIQGGGTRWECDDYANGAQWNTIHSVWMR